MAKNTLKRLPVHTKKESNVQGARKQVSPRESLGSLRGVKCSGPQNGRERLLLRVKKTLALGPAEADALTPGRLTPAAASVRRVARTDSAGQRRPASKKYYPCAPMFPRA